MLPPTYGTCKRRFRYNGMQFQSFLLNSRRPFSLKFVQTCKKGNIALQFRQQFWLLVGDWYGFQRKTITLEPLHARAFFVMQSHISKKSKNFSYAWQEKIYFSKKKKTSSSLNKPTDSINN